MNLTTTIVAAVLGSNAIFAFIQFLISRMDGRRNIEGKLVTLEKDGLRTQLLMLILLKPDEQTEILRVAEHYFKDLHGNWYMTSIFNKWLAENGHAEPEWFDKNG